MSSLEIGGPLVLKLMLDIIVDMDNSSLCSPTQSLQTLRLKDIPVKNVSTVVSYLKDAWMLFQNCTVLPTDFLCLLNSIMCSAENNDFSMDMKAIYFNHCQQTKVISYLTCLEYTESEYRKLYRTQKWDASKADLVSGFRQGRRKQLLK